MTKPPKVSVAIITYNHEKYIAQALESVLMQEANFNYEIVVSDDCSTDSTSDILHSFQAKHPDKIRLFLNQTNIGMHRNFVQAFFSCQGEYIALLEGDDYWTSPQKLQTQIDFLDHHPDYALCFHNALVVFEDQRYPDAEYCPKDLLSDLTIEQLFQFNYIPTASVVYRRGLIHKLPDWVFHLKMLDWPLHLLHAEHGKMRYLDPVMSAYRIHPGGAWASQSSVWQAREIVRMLETANQFFNLKYETTIGESINKFYEMLLEAYEKERQFPVYSSEKTASSPMKQDEEYYLAQNEDLAIDAKLNFVLQPSDGRTYVMYGSDATPISFPEGDYVSPGLRQIQPDRCFPAMLMGNPSECFWPFLRREIPHNWYIDQRYPEVGFINRDEAHIIYNSALLFKGKRGLEVGCWMGWSACHIGLAGVELDVIDPILEKPEFFQSVRDSLKRAGVLSSVRLIPGYSPEKVEELAKQEHRRWAFMFIDGNHESPYPLNDVKACEPFAEDDALILFHDLVSPGVAEGLEYLKRKGWNVMLYHTMQIMGVAWRGNVEPIQHHPDPKVFWQVPSHLKSFCGNLGQQLSDDYQLKDTLEGLQGALDWLRLQLKSSQEEGWKLHGEKAWLESELHQTHEKLNQRQSELSHANGERDAIQTQLEQANTQLEQANTQLEQANTQLEQANTQLEQANAEQSALRLKLEQNNRVITYLRQQLIQAEHTQQQLSSQVEQALQASELQLRQAQSRVETLKAKLLDKQKRLQTKKENLELKRAELKQARDRITAMETSKFWKIRKVWFNIKRPLGLGEQE